MRVARSPNEMSSISSRLRKRGKSIGFVPTMGCLHEGHLSLIRKACADNDVVVVSIFVNPTQFGPKEDYRNYPRSLKEDKKKAERAGCDIIFYPDAREIYPKGYATYVNVKRLTQPMCGISRPNHFEGVATICAKLFNIVKPNIAYFGRKDYQQSVLIKRMAEDLNMDLGIKVLPIVRQENGLAMSSRNRYLTSTQRENASVLYDSLKLAKAVIRSGRKDSSYIKRAMRTLICKKPGIHIEYITIADPYVLKDKKRVDSDVLVALAARVGKARLIDSILVRR